MGTIRAVCLSAEKGTAKRDLGRAELVARHGLKGDAHAGDGLRQVSLLSLRKIEAFRATGARVGYGDFGENIVADGIDFAGLPIGTRLRCGEVLMEITQIGKECHNRCDIFHRMGDCIMPREGVFAIVLRGGTVRTGDEINVSYRVAVVTVSDKGSRGEREDASGKLVGEIMEANGYTLADHSILPDEQAMLENELRRLCDGGLADLILTTGGTGLSPRDRTPEATAAVAERLVPGIPEAMRMKSLGLTGRAMLSRAASAIRGRTLIVNLPGSPRSVRENLGFIVRELGHGLDILTGGGGECGGK